MFSTHRHPTRKSLLSLVVLLTACAKAPPPPPPLPQMLFSFTAPEKACKAPGSMKVSFAIVASPWSAPVNTGRMEMASVDSHHPLQDLYDDFVKAMKNDFLAMTTCKGYTSRGPFNSYQEMVFPDRIGTDLVLVPEISVKVSVQSASEQTPTSTSASIVGSLFGGQAKAATVTLKGKATITGRITLAIFESVTNTRMWARNIELTPETIYFTGEREYPQGASAEVLNYWSAGDDGLIRVLGPKLQDIYGHVLQTSWNFLDPQEMELVKRQSLEPRAKSGIVIPK